MEPELGVCTITGIGPAMNKPLNTRAQLNQHRRTDDPDPPIHTGSHYTLMYQQQNTGDDQFSSVTEVLQWIAIGPLLPPPAAATTTIAHITQPPPGAAPVRPPREGHPRLTEQRVPPPPTNQRPHSQPTGAMPVHLNPDQARNLRWQHREEQRVDQATITSVRRTSPRFVHMAVHETEDDKGDRIASGESERTTHHYGLAAHHSRPTPAVTNGPFGSGPKVKTTFRHPHTCIRTKILDDEREPPNPETLVQPMPKSALRPLQRTGPLNLNEDGTEISYRKSHAGPNTHHWIQADAEEMESLFTSGTIRPLHFPDIPADTVVTYVNPVCSEKLNHHWR